MPLPKIVTPTFELDLPSSGKTIKYRPFLVKEEKLLVIALESEDSQQITSAIKAVITDCILTKDVKVDQLPTFDIEYLFLNIRGKSVGEVVDVNIVCPDDGETEVKVSINLDDIQVVTNEDHTKTVKLDDVYYMDMKYPSLDQFIGSNFESKDDQSISSTLKVITSCIDVIYTEEESWVGSDSTEKELEEFIDQLNTKQFKTIEKFFDTMPKLSHKIKVKNPKTEVESTVILEGLAAFFN